MAPLTSTSRAVLRQCARTKLPAPLATQTVSTQQRRGAAADAQDPFNRKESTKIPSFGSYFSKGSSTSNKVFQYFMVGTMGALSAAGAKATVQGEWHQKSRNTG